MRCVRLSQWLLAGFLLAILACAGGCPSDTPFVPGTDLVAPNFTDVFAYGALVQGQSGTVSVSATVVGLASPVNSVTADLSSIGGVAGQPLVRATGNFWTFAGVVTPPDGGIRTVAFTAVDAAGLSSSATTKISVGFNGTSGSGDGGGTPDGNPSVRKNPLGQSTDVSSSILAEVYVPSRYGGQLTINGAGVQLIYTDGTDLRSNTTGQVTGLTGPVVAEGDPCSYAVPQNRPGWYYIRLAGGASATISSTFVETGQASYRPWNGWWWAWNPSGGPTLYDAGGPFEKYDRVYGTKAQSWAMTNETGGAWWWGHCWGWSIASILLPEPQATTKNGVRFSADDMKGLYSALADDDPYIDQDLSIEDIPAGPPTANSGEPVDAYCDDVYRIVRTCVREDRVQVQGDLRAASTSSDRAEEIWNQAIYKYAATFSEAPGAGDEHVVQIDMQVWSNYDLKPPPTDNSLDRNEEYVYQLEFDAQGQVIPKSSKQNWISTSHFAPGELHRLTGSPYSPANPYLTRARIDGLYR